MVGDQGQGQPQQGRGRKVDPDFMCRTGRIGYCRRHHGAGVLRLSLFNTHALTAMVAVVLMSSAAEIGSHSLRRRSKCSITPTPAGKKNRERCDRNWVAGVPQWP